MNVDVTAAVITAIQVAPSPISVARGQSEQLVATATYSDISSSDITNSVTWTPTDINTTVVTPEGLLYGVEIGSTTLTATKDGVTSNTVNVDVIESADACNLGEVCIDTFNTGGGKLFTNSPSVAYADSIGVSRKGGEEYDYGVDSNFYRFDQYSARVLCDVYNTNSVGGRTNWRLATKDELELELELFGVYGHMFDARGWPTLAAYWSSTVARSVSSRYYLVSLKEVLVMETISSNTNFASCVSEP